MAWNVEFTATAEKQLKKLDKKGLWRYGVGDYRVICQIEDDRLVIAAVTVGHRKDVYDD